MAAIHVENFIPCLAHYLLDTSNHSAEGLLRQTIGVNDLAFPNPGHLRLTPRQEQLLLSRSGGAMPRGDSTAR